MAITAPTFRATQQALATAATSVTTTLPTGWQQDDLVLLTVGTTNSTTTPAYSAITGWTYVGRQGVVGAGQTTNLALDFWWRRMQTGDTAPVASNGNTSGKFGTTIAFSGVFGIGDGQATDPFDTTNGGNAASVTTSWSLGAGTTNYENSMVVYLLATEASSTTAPITSPANTTLVSLATPYNTSFTSAAGTGRAQLYGVMASAADSGTLTGTAVSGYNCWYAVALRGIDSGGTVLNAGRTSLLGAGR